MDFLCAPFVKTAGDVLELSSTHDGIIAEEQFFTGDLFIHGDQLHFCHKAAHRLIGWHETAGPCGRVLDQRPHIRCIAGIGVTDGMGNTGVRNAADGIDFCIIFCRHQGTVAVTDRFRIFSFVGG